MHGDLHTDAWLGIVENLAVNLPLGTSFIDRCICGIFLIERGVVPIHSHQVQVLTSLQNVRSPRGGRPRPHVRVIFSKPQLFSLLHSSSYNLTTIHAGSHYGNLSSRWSIADKVLQPHGGESSVDSCLGNNRHLPGTTLLAFLIKPLGEFN